MAVASEVRYFEISTPAGTTSDSPLVTSISFPPRDVVSISIRVPPGPSGQLGFRLTMAGNPVIPVNTGEWIITDDDKIDIDVEGYPDSGAWELTSYNTGIYDHSVYIRFDVTVPGQSNSAAGETIITASSLSP